LVSFILFYFLFFLRPPCTCLFPYTTLFRSIFVHKATTLAFSFCAISLTTSTYLFVSFARSSSPIFATYITGFAVSKAKFLMIFRSEEHTSELQSRFDLVCCLLLEKNNAIYT